MMKINRLLEIVYVLQRQKTVTVRALAERFGVSQRTISRDIDTLSLAGIPVYTERGKKGGVGLLPNFVLSKSILSEQEQNEILTALQALSHVKTGKTGSALQKLSAAFNKTAVRWLEVDFSDWGDSGVFDDFKAAILERRVAEFDYYGACGEKTRRRVEPAQLWFKSKAWYVKAFCLTRQDTRLFKLTRVRNLTVTGERFPEREVSPGPEPDVRPTKNVTLQLKIAPEMTHRVYDEFDQAEKQPDGSHTVTVTWPEDDWVYGTLLSFGDHIEVLAPERVREAVRERARKIFEKYT